MLAAAAVVSMGVGGAFMGLAYSLWRDNSQGANDNSVEATGSGVFRIPTEEALVDATALKLGQIEDMYGISAEGRRERAVDALARWNTIDPNDEADYLSRTWGLEDTRGGRIPTNAWLLGPYSHTEKSMIAARNRLPEVAAVELTADDVIPDPERMARTEAVLCDVEEFMGLEPDPTHERARRIIAQWEQLPSEQFKNYIRDPVVFAQTDLGTIPPKFFMLQMVKTELEKDMAIGGVAEQIYMTRLDYGSERAQGIAADVYRRWMELPEKTREAMRTHDENGAPHAPQDNEVIAASWLEFELEKRDAVRSFLTEQVQYQRAERNYRLIAINNTRSAGGLDVEALKHDETNPEFAKTLRDQAEILRDQAEQFTAYADEAARHAEQSRLNAAALDKSGTPKLQILEKNAPNFGSMDKASPPLEAPAVQTAGSEAELLERLNDPATNAAEITEEVFAYLENNKTDPELDGVREWIRANGGKDGAARELLSQQIRDNGVLIREDLGREMATRLNAGVAVNPNRLALEVVSKRVVEMAEQASGESGPGAKGWKKDRDPERERGMGEPTKQERFKLPAEPTVIERFVREGRVR